MGDIQNQSISEKYFHRFGFRDQFIPSSPNPNLGIVVVIPSYNEDNLFTSIQSLMQCEKPSCEVEVIVVLNNSENADIAIKDRHLQTYAKLKEINTTYPLHVLLEIELPKKHAGVGLARKIGMDEAARRFSEIGRNGVIACFDADAICDSNYLKIMESDFLLKHCNGCSVYFEHPLEGEIEDPKCYEGIVKYELFLRYYNLSQKFAGLPFAFHTVGSSMAVKSETYMLQGGMNRRKAGEDFYFLQKIIQTGSFVELNQTRVIPSPRTSDRVPFGTGRAISEWIEEKGKLEFTYDFRVFIAVKNMLVNLDNWCKYQVNDHDLPKELRPFFINEQIVSKVDEIRANTTTCKAFENRFFTYFDAFKMLKLTHWYRDHVHPNRPLLEMVNELNAYYFSGKKFNTELEALMELRKIERKEFI